MADNDEMDVSLAETPPSSPMSAGEPATDDAAVDIQIPAAPKATKQLSGTCELHQCGVLGESCSCPELEAEPVLTNAQLLAFEVRSRNVDWRNYAVPLNTSVRAPAVYLDRQADFISYHRVKVTTDNKRELLVCHDMMGNYLADRHFHSSEKYDDYRFLHWAAVDYFCYFSHNYVTIPPCGWINAAHCHGVPVLGTYIVEGESGSLLLQDVLRNTQNVDRVVAALTQLCKHFGFEGWLVNVEVKVDLDAVPNLLYFMRQLRSVTEKEVSHGRIFWYDSVTHTGDLAWQNELNDQNVGFFRNSHGTLVNYAWADHNLATTASTLAQEGAPAYKAFIGLDVFGRSQLGRFQSYKTLERIVDSGFSVGIFAPAWCYETLEQFGYDIRRPSGSKALNTAFLSRNDRWWSRIWEYLATHPYGKLPFYTDFNVGSGRSTFQRGGHSASTRPFFNLSRQSLQPSVPLGNNAEHSFETAYTGGSSLRITNYTRGFRLFACDFQLRLGVLLLSYAYKLEDQRHDENTMDVVLRVTVPDNDYQDLYLFCGLYEGHHLNNGMCHISQLIPDPEALPPGVAHHNLPLVNDTMSNGWRTRHYLVRFDGPVIVKDIGLKCARAEMSYSSAYLGAIYVQSLELSTFQLAEGGLKVSINVYEDNMWNNNMDI